MLKLKNLCSGYGKVIVADNINLTFEKNSLSCIIGKNGCGKSTLLKTASGILPPFSGEVLVDNQSLAEISRKEAAKKIAYLPQSKTIPEMTVAQIVLHGRFPHIDYPRRYSQKDHDIAKKAMAQVSIENLKDCYLSTLSGGMCQNAFIAMALAQSTDYILLDEPTTHLDPQNSFKLMDILQSLTKDGKGIVSVLHDIPLAMKYADRVIVMDSGKIVKDSTPDEVFQSGIIEKTFGIKLKRQTSSDGFSYFF